ncbi:hypothetical protein DFH28DRAFT_1186515 [Melampsora americana]|nr:hypothetical protein DFH28DRAFT_1186515 [Melampsora americana]
MLNFPSSSKSKGFSGWMADSRGSRTLPIPTRIMQSPPRLPLPQGLGLASAGHERDSFFECVTQSCGLLEQVDSVPTVTMSYPRLIPRSASSPANSLTRSHAIRHGYSSSSSSLTSTSSNSSSSSSSSQSSQFSASCSSGSSTSRLTRQERRKGAYFTKITIYRDDRVEDCFVYAPSRVSSSSITDFASLEREKGCDMEAPHSRRPGLSTDSVCARPETPPSVPVSTNRYDEDDEGEEEVLEDDKSQDLYPRPSSSMSTRSDPFEFSAYLSRPACQRLDCSLSRASSVTIRPTNCSLSRASSMTIRPAKQDSVVLNPSAPTPRPTDPIHITTPRMGPPESVYAALRALKTIQAQNSFLFDENVEEMDDGCLTDSPWALEDSSKVGIAL